MKEKKEMIIEEEFGYKKDHFHFPLIIMNIIELSVISLL